MQFYSTNHKSPAVSLKKAVLEGLPPDNGLYMPETINTLSPAFIRDLPNLPFTEIACEVGKALLQDSLPASTLRQIIEASLTFDAPLVQLSENIFALELFHGPTLAFKDFAARFMAQLMSYYVKDSERELNILVATSGDTGSAVASGFFQAPGIRVFVLYPGGKVSRIQEQQLATLGHNITALEIDGTFDDCQRIVKSAFLDKELREKYFLTSANSINIARLIPQTFYYFRAFAQLQSLQQPVVVSVPSGNFGNLTAGLIAKRMGLPIAKFIAATNINNVVPNYLTSGKFAPRPSQKTYSNAMDVGNPSNFARMLALYGHDVEKMRADVYGVSFTDTQTVEAIKTVFKENGYILDPHGAVGYLGLQAYLKNFTTFATGIFLETAHPAKFQDVVENAINMKVTLPETLKHALEKPKQAIRLSNQFSDFKEFLI